jgi:hypothetical protein
MLSTDTLIIRKGCSQSPDPAVAVRELHDAIWQPDISFALFYCSPQYDISELERHLAKAFRKTNLIGCTTAGEITPQGYLNGALTGVSVASKDFTVVNRRIDRLAAFEVAQGMDAARLLLTAMETMAAPPTEGNTFAFLLIDGLSTQEEMVVSAVHKELGKIQLFGGSAGDGTRFQRTYVYHDHAFHTDSAILSLIQTTRPFYVFKTQHFVSAEEKMVVTRADPVCRIVTEINGEPAGREYARVVGLDVDKLTPMIFASHPVVVKIGGSYYVRSIQKVNEDGSLSFFCAIDEGIVLTVGRGVDMVENLHGLFSDIRSRVGVPKLVLGCDCILRHIEMDQRGIRDVIGRILNENNVIGFSTYGEQYNAMHVNQTFTGVAIGE